MKVYRSRIGWEIWGPVVLLFAWIVYQADGTWPILVALFLTGSFIAAMVLRTRYVISGDTLIVKCWPVISLEIDIKSIHRIRRTWNPLSSPAASYIGRIEVHYDRGKSCIISPNDRQGFIEDLLERNKSILTFEVPGKSKV